MNKNNISYNFLHKSFLAVILLALMFTSCIDITGLSNLSEKELQTFKKSTITIYCGGPMITDENRPLYLINGKVFKTEIIDDFKPEYVDSISVLKGRAAVQKYGKAGKYGAILIYVDENYFSTLINIRKKKTEK